MNLAPFPRPHYKTYFTVGFTIGASIIFILMVFQPFGTAQFTHEYKRFILAGYGIVSTIAVAVYYGLSLFVINRWLESRWTILHEAIDFFVCLMVSMAATYVYYAIIFGLSVSMAGLLNFLRITCSVGFLPTLAIFIYLYNRYKGVIRSHLTVSKDNAKKITLKGTNKSEHLITDINSIIYIKADDNYVIIHINDDEKEQKHMIRSTLKLIYEQLDNEIFYKCHRSYIINIGLINELLGNKNSAKVSLLNAAKSVPISRSNYDFIKSYITEADLIKSS